LIQKQQEWHRSYWLSCSVMSTVMVSRRNKYGIQLDRGETKSNRLL
jgi:hypothetical protein